MLLVSQLPAMGNQTRSALSSPSLTERVSAALAPYRLIAGGYADPAKGITFVLRRHRGALQITCAVAGAGSEEERLADARAALERAAIRSRTVARGQALVLLGVRS